jgi:hypothetical protein
MEAHCEGGQSPPQAVMPRKKKRWLQDLEEDMRVMQVGRW